MYNDHILAFVSTNTTKTKNIAEKFRDCNQLVKKKVKLISQKG